MNFLQEVIINLLNDRIFILITSSPLPIVTLKQPQNIRSMRPKALKGVVLAAAATGANLHGPGRGQAKAKGLLVGVGHHVEGLHALLVRQSVRQ